MADSSHDGKLTTYVERFLTSRRAKGLVPRTISWYYNHLKIYLHWLSQQDNADGDLDWNDPNAIDLFLAEQRDLGLKDNTIRARYISLKIWFEWLRKRKYITESPMDMIDEPSVSQEPIQHMTLVEYQQLIGSISGQHWIDKRDRCLIYVLFWCGLRISEACELRQSDIDPLAKTVKVRKGKGGDGRFVPCGDDLYPIILDYVFSRPTEHEWLFLGCNGAGRVRGKFTPGGARIMMERRCAEAGMRHISPHKGRHGLAMEMLNAGLDMSAVSKVLGHSSQKTTSDFYAKWLTGPLTQKYTEVRDKLLAAPKSK